MHTRLLGLTTFAAILLASSAAFAVPTVNIDGILVPAASGPGATVLDAETSFEKSVQNPGEIFNGVFHVTQVQTGGGTATWVEGQNGKFLDGVFDNFTVIVAQAPTASTDGQLYFTGGQIEYYDSIVNNFHTDSTNGGSGQAGDIAAIRTGGTLWLEALAATSGFVNPADLTQNCVTTPVGCVAYTLKINLPAGTSFTQFTGASTNVVEGDVVAGEAMPYFDTNTIHNLNDGTQDDVIYSGNAKTLGCDSGVTCDWPINGTDQLQGSVLAQLPEPVSISLFGAGLVGAAVFGARRRKTRKA